MIALPPGCTVTYAVWIDVDELTDDMIEWYKMIDGTVIESKFWDSRGREQIVKYVSYGKAKRCHHHQNGTGGTRLHFHGDDASTASMLLPTIFKL